MAQTDTAIIRHSVIFKLKCAEGPAEKQDFFMATKQLANIPGVEKFECLKQTNRKNKFEYGLSMEFANQELFDRYTNHPDHLGFVQNVWLKQVEDLWK